MKTDKQWNELKNRNLTDDELYANPVKVENTIRELMRYQNEDIDKVLQLEKVIINRKIEIKKYW